MKEIWLSPELKERIQAAALRHDDDFHLKLRGGGWLLSVPTSVNGLALLPDTSEITAEDIVDVCAANTLRGLWISLSKRRGAARRA